MDLGQGCSRTAVVALALLASMEPASAACFEIVGCTNTQYMSKSALAELSCDALWTVRNTIYYENGYCFQTARGQQNFSNDTCLYSYAGDVPLNTFEVGNIERVRSVEKAKGC
jgi:hypothetical protein